MQEGHVLGQAAGLAEIVGGHDDGDALGREAGDHLLDDPRGRGVERGTGLVQEQHLRRIAQARASARRCCSPPDRSRAGRSASGARPKRSSVRATAARRAPRDEAAQRQRIVDVAPPPTGAAGPGAGTPSPAPRAAPRRRPRGGGRVGSISPWQRRSKRLLPAPFAPARPAAARRQWQRDVRQQRLPPTHSPEPLGAAQDAAGSMAGAGRRRASQPPPRPLPGAPGGAFSVSVSAIRMIPSATARPRLPRLVSSVIAVVMVRVWPAMLPPTISTAPTSAEARPKPASTPVSRLTRPSHSSVGTARSRPRPGSAAARGTRPRDPRPPSGSARRRSAGSAGLGDDHRRRA
jgi:hypothetical protein